jgi:methylmalonyl-CoA mutase, N-terminal domain
VDALGGVLPAIEKGFFQNEISSAAYEYQRQVDAGDRKIIGVNAFTATDDEMRIPILDMDPQGFERQVARLERCGRSATTSVSAETSKLRYGAAEGDENLMPYLLDAVHAYATLGEITDVLREVFGVYEEPTWI